MPYWEPIYDFNIDEHPGLPVIFFADSDFIFYFNSVFETTIWISCTETIAMSNALMIDTATMQQWLTARREPKAIEEELAALGLDADAIAAHLKAFRRLRNAKKQTSGFICIGIGAFLGFLSCVLTLINPVPALYDIILYGLTSLAICMIMAGLYFIFE